ncbi:inositol 1,4,5-trisphosphate receptor-interacting protein-like 1 [Onychostruthus taczanowskii]|uniref:inositol 1,4,5-trisphosphate receptor-interacting protein-like 1 n=1 Tax=Onychostruthus taczanowskii TaxID=356909 RepID=UPI001B8080B2|nr:inositol 1,4,5-trisphosphate receptor-interacting protein-like 1 [Onychostruthus taczanowskii]
MALLPFLFVLVQSLIQYPQPAGDGLDEATHRRMQERQELLEHEMARLLQELERGPPDEGWGAMLFGALQQWPFWVLAGLLLLLGLWFSCRRRSCEVSSSGKDQSSCKTLEDDEWETEEEEDCVDSEEDGEDGGNTDVTVEADKNGSGSDREGSPLVCTCKREQLGEKLLCFLHDSQEELWRKHKRSLLETLCTGSYLDVEKTSHWFHQLVRCSWLHVPHSYSWHLVFQSCSRSCQFQLSKGKKSLMVEMLFGVRQGDSDIFVVSQPTEAQKGASINFVSSQPAKANIIASTAWPETYAVAEAKFFQHIARKLPCRSLHLKCLQVFTCILRGTGFSSSTWKTVVMHVLTTVPVSQWRRREFERRLWDVMAYLHRCLQLKRLEHFVQGNERLPAEISLPPATRGVEPLNLFEHLARDPATHREAMQAYGQLRYRLWMMLSSH